MSTWMALGSFGVTFGHFWRPVTNFSGRSGALENRSKEGPKNSCGNSCPTAGVPLKQLEAGGWRLPVEAGGLETRKQKPERGTGHTSSAKARWRI